MVEDIEKQIDFLKRYFDGLQKAISKARKKGLDTRLAELRMMNIPHKIKMAEVTKDKKDINRLKILLSKVEHEIPK